MTGTFLKFDMRRGASVTRQNQHNYSDTRHGHFLNSTGDIGISKPQGHVILTFLKIDMRHQPPPPSRAPGLFVKSHSDILALFTQHPPLTIHLPPPYCGCGHPFYPILLYIHNRPSNEGPPYWVVDHYFYFFCPKLPLFAQYVDTHGDGPVYHGQRWLCN